ncbi:MAG: nucleoside triphosphate pyrophosphohydrolase [bacterium]|nr:MAG: nucleoside triphosphate pyrophosphohydrolase [bacterium]
MCNIVYTDDMSADDRNIEPAIRALRKTLRRLRGDDGCPWDREQSIDDLISHLISEAYELLHAEKSGDWDEVQEEFGDVLFLLIFIHELLQEHRQVPLAEIIAQVHRKIINRHPHVFGSSQARNKQESIAEWNRIKRSEKKESGRKRAFSSIPPELPSLRKAVAIQKEAAGTGFDWPDRTGIIAKLKEEIAELENEALRGDRKGIKDEIGDLLFTAVNLARRFDVDPVNALERTSVKFLNRFREMEEKAEAKGRTLDTLSLDEMEELWNETKRHG